MSRRQIRSSRKRNSGQKRLRRNMRLERLESRELLATIGNNIGVGTELRNYRVAIAATAESPRTLAELSWTPRRRSTRTWSS
jgi:hypothetical protein